MKSSWDSSSRTMRKIFSPGGWGKANVGAGSEKKALHNILQISKDVYLLGSKQKLPAVKLSFSRQRKKSKFIV